MKTRGVIKAAVAVCLVLLASSLWVPVGVYASHGRVEEVEEVEEDQAIAVADHWYRTLLNARYLGISQEERAARLGHLPDREVFYFSSAGDLRRTPPREGSVLAYVVTYQPSGYVIVSGTDHVEPVLAFSVESTFWWDERGVDTLRSSLASGLRNLWKSRGSGVHPAWADLRAELGENKSSDPSALDTTEPDLLWHTASWHQGWPYNEVVVAQNGDNPNVPTGCTATALAIKFRFQQWPLRGNGTLDYPDEWGDIQYYHEVNLDGYTYQWANMPRAGLTESNLHVARLMYHCGVAVKMNYEEGGSSGDPSVIYEERAVNSFPYKGTECICTEVYGGAEHIGPLKRSLAGGLVNIVCSDSHAMVVTGYWKKGGVPYFCVNHGHGGHPQHDCEGFWATLAAVDIRRSWPYSSPSNYIYVDAGWSGQPAGYLQMPFNSFQEGLSSVPEGGQLWLKGGTYAEVPAFLTKRMTIRSYEGAATLIAGQTSLGGD